MRKYIHTIFRTFCIGTMLCGSMSAWADDPEPVKSNFELWAEALNITYSEGMGADEENAFEITGTNWSDFVSTVQASTLTTEGVYFKLSEDITIAFDNLPESAISVSNLSCGDYTITVGGSEDLVPFSLSDNHLFDGDIDKSVIYYYSLTDNNWSNFVSNCSENEDDYFYLESDISMTATELPTTALSITNFVFNSKTVTVGASDDLVEFSVSDNHLFDADNDKSVIYYYSLTDSNWSDFVSNCSENEDDYFYLESDISMAASDLPSNPISVTNFSFGNSNTITVGTSSELVEFSSSSYKLFDNEDNEKTVTFYYSLTNTNWSDFIEKYSDYSDDYFYLGENIDFTDSPSTPISDCITADNFGFGSYTISVGCESSPATYPSSPANVFANTDLDSEVAYHYGITSEDNWSDLSGISSVGENYHFYISTIDFSSVPSQIPGNITNTNCTINSAITVSDYVRNYGPIFANTTLNASVEYDLTANSTDDFAYMCEHSSDLKSDKVTITIDDTNTEYDLSTLDFSSFNLTNCKIECDSEVKIFLPDNCGSDVSFGDENLKYYKAPSYYLLDTFYKGVLSDSDKQGDNFDEYTFYSNIKDLAGHGTEASPYLIANYEMLSVLVGKVNSGLNTEGMHIRLIADINAQGGNRLTDEKGNKIIASPTQNVQFSAAFKGVFNGNGYSLGGFTRPLFSSLDGASITRLGIVDCNMTTPALAESTENSATVSMSYVSGVSTGLIPESGISAEDCYAYNPAASSDKYKTYSLTAETVDDASGTHQILYQNCYTIGSSKYSDCTLFIPTDNTMYKYNDGTPTDQTNLTDYYYEQYWDGAGSNLKWSAISDNTYVMDNPFLSNVSLLHNVVRTDGCKITEDGKSYDTTYAIPDATDDLYSWYLVDKESFTACPAERIKNIYYSRGAGAYDGLNTVYLPFAWNFATDVVNAQGKAISGAAAYILADKTSGEGADEHFDNDGSFKDYSEAKSLLFISPSREEFYNHSCALPTVLYVPQSGWAIEKHAGDKWFYYSKGMGDFGSVNLGDRFEGELTNLSEPYNGRSYMDITRLASTDTGYDTYACYDSESNTNGYDSGRALHCGTFKKLDAGTFGKGTCTSEGVTFSGYKLNSAGTGFAAVTSTSTVLPFRTFFAIAPGATSTLAKSLGFGFADFGDDDTPTSIDGIPTEGIKLLTPEQSRVYSLDGRYVGQHGKKLPAGLYIMNGKKLLVK